MTKGPEPLYSEEMERALLGALLIDPQAYVQVAPIIDADDFFIRKYGFIYEAVERAAKNGGVDYVTVADELERHEKLEAVGGASTLVNLTGDVFSVSSVESYAQRVSEDAQRRRLEDAARKVWQVARNREASITDVQSRVESIILGARRDKTSGYRSVVDIASQELDLITSWQENPLKPGETRGIATGLRNLDRFLGGLFSGYYLIAGRPSMGKTSLLLQIVDHLCSQEIPCLLFSMEMSAQQIVRRMACSRAGVSETIVQQGRATPDQYTRIVYELGTVAEWPLVICDDSLVRALDVLAKANRFVIERGDLGAIFLDGIWLMTPTRNHENRTQTVGSISRDVKRIQRELNVPVVAAHQLSRTCETRADKRPILSDLRDSGDLEQDADVVLMLYRDAYYDPDTERQNIAEIWIRKNRLGGPAGEVCEFVWKGETTRFYELERRESYDT